jgi:three-Cys-motif partner protein
LFIEQDPVRAGELEKLKADFPHRSGNIEVVVADANEYLSQWSARTDWRTNRAVVFLDPYGMQVNWSVIEAMGKTRAIDLWLLFPLGMAVNRLLTRSEPPPDEWARSLTRIFGTEDWRDAFYARSTRLTLFGEEHAYEKQVDLDKIGQFFVRRLGTVFTAVADNPLRLVNSRNVPLYLLCFASGNPKGAPTAIKIAQHILRR